MLFPSKVGVQTTHLVTQCLCNHLTFFGSSFFVTPNLVDPSRSAELFGTFVENPVVVCFVGALFVVYFLVLVWARRKDILDVAKVGHICRCPLPGPQFVCRSFCLLFLMILTRVPALTHPQINDKKSGNVRALNFVKWSSF